MKVNRALVVIGLTIAVGVTVVRWGVAQTNNSAKRPLTGDSNPALDRLIALESYLESNHDTNGLRLFDEYSNASIATQNAADMGIKLHVLKDLRDGRTNDAIRLLESTVDGDIVSFAASYKELSKSQQEWIGLTVLSSARWYYNKFPRKDEYGAISNAFKILDEKEAK